MMKSCIALARIWALAVLMAVAGSVVAQQTYPNKPIRLITPYPPGGGTSVVARIIGEKLTESWGQQVLVDNRPGGDTTIGTDALAKSPPNGYTISLAATTHVLIPQLIATPYDPIKDFAAVTTLAITEFVLAVHPQVPANDLQAFIALAKSKPGQLNYATAGAGTMTHLTSEFFNIMAGVKMEHIPYKGGGPAITDLIGGQVQSSFLSPPAAIPHIKSGRLKALAISGATRLPALPQVPTFTEAGLPGFDVGLWYAVLAPAGTPKEIIAKLSTEIARILAMPDTKEKLARQGMSPFISTSEQFAALMKADMVKWGKVIKTANIRIDH